MVKSLLNKKLYAVLILSILFMSFLTQVNITTVKGEIANNTKTEEPLDNGDSEEALATRDVLDFLRDVVQIDLSKYEVKLSSVYTNYWPELGGICEKSGTYTLDSTGIVDSTGQCGTSLLEVHFRLWDGKVVNCDFAEKSRGPAFYTEQPVTDLHGATSGILQRYQIYTGDEQITQMKQLFDTADVTSNSTKTADNLSIEILVDGKANKIYLTWGNMLNGADYSRLKIVFQDGQFCRFYDDRSFYKLGSSEINISEEEAIDIALKQVKSFSYTYKNQKITLTSENIDENLISTQPNFLNKTDPMVKYPCWVVNLGLDDLYPGDIAFIKVMIWADNGEVVSCEAMGYGFPYPASTPGVSPKNTQTGNTQPTSNNSVPWAAYIVVVCVAVAIPTVLVALALKKRSK